MSDSTPDLTDAPPSRAPIAAVLTGVLLALPGLWVGVSSIGFPGQGARDATVVVAWWGAAGGGVACGLGAALAVGMLLGMA